MVLQSLLDKLNRQSQHNIQLPSLLAALSSLLEKGRHSSASDSTDVSTTSDEASKSDEACRLSPDSTAGHFDLSPHCRVKMEPTAMDDPAMMCASTPGDCLITSKCDAQALVGTVHRQLREAEQLRRTVSSFPTILPANLSGPILTDVMPDCDLVVDHALLELAAEARQIPAVGSEREVLVEQVTQCVVDAHLQTCIHTRESVAAGFQRYLQVCLHCDKC